MTIRKADGFALIDVLFVCAIMGVLATIALPRMLLARQSADVRADVRRRILRAQPHDARARSCEQS